MFLGLLDPDPDPVVRDTDPAPDPSIIKQKYFKIERKNFTPTALCLFYDFLSLKNVNVSSKSNKQNN
jgi:hypothetical protein